MKRRFTLVLAALVSVVGGVCIPESASASGAIHLWPHPHYRVGGQPMHVDVRHLTHTAVFHPTLPRPARLPRRRVTRSGQLPAVVAIGPATQVNRAQAPLTEQKLASFPVMDALRQIGLWGSDQNLEPPDTQLSAGPANLAEADNSTLSEWSRSGSLLGSTDLNAFFSVPAGFEFADPRLLYDSPSGRWFLSGFSFDSADDSNLYVAVSGTSDPTASWTWYLLGSSTGVLADQPMIGVSLDKVVISWNDFSSMKFIGQQTWVLQKSDLTAGQGLHIAAFPLDATRFRIVPSQELALPSTEWLVYNNADCSAAVTCNQSSPTLGLVAVNGTPLEGNVAASETDPALIATTNPPQPRQPSSMPVISLGGIDDRLLSAVWQNGILWMSGNDACTPAGDSTSRSCMRLVEVSTTGTPSVTQDFDAGSNGFDLYYPAVTLDGSGDLFTAYSESSPSMYPSALGVDSLASSPTTFENAIVIASGQTSYNGKRWGDYSGAAQDPLHPADVWLTAEYQASASRPGDWGTATARVAIQPTITNLSPNSSPVNLQQPLTITGSHFQAGANVVFGARPATGVVVVNSTAISVIAPTGVAQGPVNVTINQPDGTSAVLPMGYTYTREVAFQSGSGTPPSRTGVNQSSPRQPGPRIAASQPSAQPVATALEGGLASGRRLLT